MYFPASSNQTDKINIQRSELNTITGLLPNLSIRRPNQSLMSAPRKKTELTTRIVFSDIVVSDFRNETVNAVTPP